MLSDKKAKDKAYRTRPYLTYKNAETVHFLGKTTYGSEKLSNAWHVTLTGLFKIDEIDSESAEEQYRQFFVGIFNHVITYRRSLYNFLEAENSLYWHKDKGTPLRDWSDEAREIMRKL